MKKTSNKNHSSTYQYSNMSALSKIYIIASFVQMSLLVAFIPRVTPFVWRNHQRNAISNVDLHVLRRSLSRFATKEATTTTDANNAKQNAENTPVQSGLLKNFIANIIEDDLAKGKNGGRVVTRFPPEPNGYLHLGHAKSVNLNFGIAAAYKGVTNMRLDDTNPSKEDMEYVLSILDDVRWLVTGDTKANPAPWSGDIRHASDYFQTIYDAAEYLIVNGLAYVDELTPGMPPNLRALSR